MHDVTRDFFLYFQSWAEQKCFKIYCEVVDSQKSNATSKIIWPHYALHLRLPAFKTANLRLKAIILTFTIYYMHQLKPETGKKRNKTFD